MKVKWASLQLKMFLVAFFAIAPIYKMPPFSIQVWLVLKCIFLILVFIIGFASYFGRSRITFKKLDILFLFAIVTSSVFLFRNQYIYYSVIMAYFFYKMGCLSKSILTMDELIRMLIISSRICVFFVVYVLYINIYGGALIVDITMLNSNTWGLLIATLFILLLYSYSLDRSFLDLVLLFFYFFVILSSGSRGGLLVTFIAVLMYVGSSFSLKRKVFSMALIFSFVVVSLSQIELLLDYRFFYQLNEYLNGGDVELSTGRVDGFLIAYPIILEAPIIGVGNVDLADYGLSYEQIHNFFIRLLAEVGLFGLIPILFLIIHITVRLLNTDDAYQLLSRFIILLLLAPLMYEPNGLFGNFFVAGILWFLIGALLSNSPTDSGTCQPSLNQLAIK